MKAFPFLTNYVNQTFENEKGRLDYIFLRPILQVSYFFLKAILFPLKFLFHRRAYGFEARCIDGLLAFGMKYFATVDAVEMMVRHVKSNRSSTAIYSERNPTLRASGGNSMVSMATTTWIASVKWSVIT